MYMQSATSSAESNLEEKVNFIWTQSQFTSADIHNLKSDDVRAKCEGEKPHQK